MIHAAKDIEVNVPAVNMVRTMLAISSGVYLVTPQSFIKLPMRS